MDFSGLGLSPLQASQQKTGWAGLEMYLAKLQT